MQTSLDHVEALIKFILKILMNPQFRPLDSDANLDIFWPHFVCNSSACTSWLWIGIRYLSNWNKFKHLMWNIKFYNYSYSHSILTDYSIITGGVTMIFFLRQAQRNKTWTELTYLLMDHQGLIHFSQSAEAEQASYEKICLRVLKPNTTNHWLQSIVLIASGFSHILVFLNLR